MTNGQCDANASHGFLLKVCMGIVAVAGMPETRINLKKINFFFLACFRCYNYHLHHFCQLQYYNSFPLSLLSFYLVLICICVPVSKVRPVPDFFF